MTLKRSRTALFVLMVIYGGCSNAVNKRERQCCGYSMNNSESSLCRHSNGCIIMSPQDGVSKKSLPLQQCQITLDSKLESNDTAKEENKMECLAQQFLGNDIRQAQVVYGIIYGSNEKVGNQVEYEPHPSIEIDDSIPLPFSIHPYILSNPPASELPAIEMRVAYGGARIGHTSPSPWSKLRFRILNRNHCSTDVQESEETPSSRDSCLPRCVSVHQKYEDSNRSGVKDEEIIPSEYMGS